MAKPERGKLGQLRRRRHASVDGHCTDHDTWLQRPPIHAIDVSRMTTDPSAAKGKAHVHERGI
jgi:hypothetical protein